MIPGIEALACGPLAVPTEVMAHVVQVESARNPFAIGVVGGRLERQPRSLEEATATVAMLDREGHNYSVGLAQVNRMHFARLGWEDPARAFDACGNLRAGAEILADCLQRHDGRWGDAFSCYYSGNASTGYEHGYVQKVMASMAGTRIDERLPMGAAAGSPYGVVPLRASPDPVSRRDDGVSRVQPIAGGTTGSIAAPTVPSAEAQRAAPHDAPTEDPARVF